MQKRRHGSSAQQRRAALIDAAVEVAAEKGMSGVTHRAVTEQAGLPLATVGYFFDSITDLAVEALRTKVAEDVAQMNALATQLVEGERRPLSELVDVFAGAAAAPRTEGMAFVEALLTAARDPRFRAFAADVLLAGRGVVSAASAAADAEVDDPGAFLALVHGYLLHALAAPDLIDAEALARGARSLLIGELVQQGRLDLAQELVRR
ncbi:MAG TPA: TetR family transcriptional regulator [Acidimicrobiales bacterium]|nr:TetR family transcriptional regulator [Acidimicrobiales bacterium]